MTKKTSSKVDDTIQGLKVEERFGWIWVTLPDAINMDNYQRIECRVESMLTDGCRIAIDLGETRNFYSSGFGMVVRLKKMIDQKNGTLYLVNASERTLEALQGVGLTRLMKVYSEADALDFLTT